MRQLIYWMIKTHHTFIVMQFGFDPKCLIEDRLALFQILKNIIIPFQFHRIHHTWTSQVHDTWYHISGWVQDCSVLYTWVYERVYETSAAGLRSICLIHPGVRDKRQVSEIDLSQPRHETAFWWHNNGPVTSQLSDPIKWPNYPLQLIGIYVPKTHTTKNPWRKDVVDRQMYNCVGYFCIYPYGLSLNGWHALLCIRNNRHGLTITTHATRRHFLIWMTTVRQPTKRRRSCVLTLIYTFICVYWWTRQRIHNTLIVVDRYLRLMGDKTIPGSAEPRLNSFYPPFIAGINLPHKGAVNSYNLRGISPGGTAVLHWAIDTVLPGHNELKKQ